MTEKRARASETQGEMERALHLLEHTKKNVFVTGRAGTGKSTLLNRFKRETKKRVAVVAPTGVAAVHVGGRTIHSFFGFRPNVTVDAVRAARDKRVFRALDTLVVDEVSMVRADLFDCMDRALKLNRGDYRPFGGVQLALFGDPYQLPPVVSRDEEGLFASFYKSPYFFDAHAFKQTGFEVVELEKVFRQRDPAFVEALDAIRHDRLTEEQLARLNRRVAPGFEPPRGEMHVRLCTQNRMADAVNARELDKLSARTHRFCGETKGDFSPEYLPCEKELDLKEGAQVMFLNNDSEKRWVNGTMGTVKGFVHGESGKEVVVALEDGQTVRVGPHTWELFRARHDTLQNALAYDAVGAFTQYPLRLAWAITIHKSQGKTFERTVIDMGSGAFATGQAYVALSRCTSLDGVVLKKPLSKKDVRADARIVAFMERARKSGAVHAEGPLAKYFRKEE